MRVNQMTHFSILLLGIYAMNVLLFTSFTPLSNGAKAGKLDTFPTTQIFAPALGVATRPDKTSTDFFEKQQPVADTTIYLPVVMNNFHTYSGTITDDGVPVPGHELDLRFFDGSVWSTYDTQVTDPSGSFFFTDLPELISGQEYYVRWFNNLDNSNHLSAYYCDTIDLDNIDSGLLACDFNIHNVFHVSPDNAASVRLPKNFEWTLRPTITDNYELDISDTIDDDPWWWTDHWDIQYIPIDISSNRFSDQSRVRVVYWGVWDKRDGISYYYRRSPSKTLGM
jgi:hypothetical protein